jgi:Flp pilus assembly protein TadG
MKRYFRDKRKTGQAMVETALVLPLLVLLLLGVGYFGSIITLQHNLTVAARYAARSVAIESTRDPTDRAFGTFFPKVNAGMFKNYAMRSLPGLNEKRLTVQPVDLNSLIPFKDFGSTSTMTEINGYTSIFLLSGTSAAHASSVTMGGKMVTELQNMTVGLGVVFFGARLTYRLTELDWLARFLFRKKEGVTIDAVALMPAELPLRSGPTRVNAGLMDINDGLFSIVRTDPNDPKDPNSGSYVDLIPPN